MNIKNLYIKGLKLSKDGKYSKAISEFDRILSDNPKNAEVLSDRGVARFHLNDIEGALSDLNKALELEPENPYRYLKVNEKDSRYSLPRTLRWVWRWMLGSRRFETQG